ncbi:MAG: virginiamycin B lyase family protein, partial [Ktedonobacterales bacterium]
MVSSLRHLAIRSRRPRIVAAAGASLLAVSMVLAGCGSSSAFQGRTTGPTSLTPHATVTGGASIVEYAIPDGDGYPETIVVGPDNNLWITQHLPPDDNSDTPYIGRLTPTGTLTEFPFQSHGSSHNPDGMTVGPEKNLWFTESGSGTMGRASVNGDVSEFALANVNARPSAITPGPDGALWFTESNANKIGRSTVGGTITEFPIPTVAAFASGIVAGPDGALWFT